MKICPFCAEEIQDAAIKCKHCSEFLDGSGRSNRMAAQPEKPVLPWYARTSFIVLTFVTLPPLALPLIWMRPKLHLAWKIIITLVILWFCWYSYTKISEFLQYFDEQTKMLNQGVF